MLVQNTFETGLAPGTLITIANSDDGTAGDPIVFVDQGTSGSSIAYDNAQAMHGTLSLKFTQGATPTFKNVSWNLGGAETTFWGRFYYYATALPANNVHAFNTYTGTADGGYIDIDNNGKISFIDSAFVNRGTSVSTLTLNAWNRIEYQYFANVSTGNIVAKLFLGDSTTVIETVTGTNGNFGAQVTDFGFGMHAVAASHVFWIDDIQANDTGYPGPSGTVGTTVPRQVVPIRSRGGAW